MVENFLTEDVSKKFNFLGAGMWGKEGCLLCLFDKMKASIKADPSYICISFVWVQSWWGGLISGRI